MTASAVLRFTPTARAREPDSLLELMDRPGLFSVEALAPTLGGEATMPTTLTVPPASTAPFMPSPSVFPSPMRALADWLSTLTARDPARSTLAEKSAGRSGP